MADIMKNIKLFGASSVSGHYFKKNYKKYLKSINLKTFSRSNKDDINFDLKNPKFSKDLLLENETLIISLAPIWLIVPFLKIYLKKINTIKIKGLIVVSSTSVITKKFSWNRFDKELHHKLSYWEDELIKLNKIYNLDLTIIRPTLIYGDIGFKEDKNLSFLSKIIANFLFLPIPKETGIRQPIHYSQLVKSIFQISKFYLNRTSYQGKKLNILNIGGDEELTYEKMLLKILENYPRRFNFIKFRLIKIPNNLYFLLCSPLIIISPKYFAAILRLSINMGSFIPAYKIIGEKITKFPVKIK